MSTRPDYCRLFRPAGQRARLADIQTRPAGPSASRCRWDRRMGVERLHRVATGSGVLVGIVGTGIDDRHPDISSGVARSESFCPQDRSPIDPHGHGTYLAGIIGAWRGASAGWGTAPDVTLASARVVGDDGHGRGDRVAQATEWLAAIGARVILMGVEADGPDPLVERAIAEVCQMGVLVVRTPRSSRAGEPHPPGDAVSSRVVVAGACGYDGRVGARPMGWTDVDVVYTGYGIRSSYPARRTAVWSHPIVAAAGVAGLLACIISHQERDGSTVQTDMVRRILIGSCRPYEETGDRGERGYGVPIPADILCADPPLDLGSVRPAPGWSPAPLPVRYCRGGRPRRQR